MKSKRILSAILVSILLMTTLASSAAALTMGVVRTSTSGGSVWLRTGPSTRYARIGLGYSGDLVRVLNSSSYKNWWRVTLMSRSYYGKTGWMSKTYLTKLKSPDFESWGALGHVKTKYASSTVNLRTGPSTRYKVSASLNPSDVLIILGKRGNWYHVQIAKSEKVGYIYKTYVANGVVAETTANVNLRKKASSSSKVLRVVPYGASITVLNVGKYWSKVKHGSKTGYIYNKYISMDF